MKNGSQSADRITYYDFADLHFVGFYLNALAENQRRLGYRFLVSRQPPESVREALMAPKWRRLRFAMTVLEATIGGHRSLCCIDAHDSSRLDYDGARFGYHYPLLEVVDWYFKSNYNPKIVAADPRLRGYQGKIVPVTPFVPLAPSIRVPYLPRLLPSRRDGWRLADGRRRLRTLRSPISVARIRAQRTRPKDLEVLFVTSYRRGEHHRAATALRLELLEGLAALNLGDMRAGFAAAEPLPPRAAAFALPRLPTTDYLRELGRARIMIYTRGLHDCLSSKLSFGLGVGAALVGQPVFNQPQLFANHPLLSRQLAFETPREIVARVRELIANPMEIDQLSRANALFFDTHLTPTHAVEHVYRLLSQPICQRPTC